MNIDDVNKVCVVGAGAMGRQIALNTALYGFKVSLADVSADMMNDAKTWAKDYLDGRVAKGKMTKAKAETGLNNLEFAPSLEEAAKDAQVVIEAIIEKLDIKRELFAELDNICPLETIMASNSSTIVSSKIADATKRSDKVCNMHYFNPALVMELVEVVKGPHTSQDTVGLIMEFARRTNKVPILLEKEISGFVVNRILGAVHREALFLLENGIASIEDIDIGAEKGLRFPMGPFRLMDFTGIDVSYLVRKQRYEESGDPNEKPAKVLEEKYLTGEYGRKTGKGWYDY